MSKLAAAMAQEDERAGYFENSLSLIEQFKPTDEDTTKDMMKGGVKTRETQLAIDKMRASGEAKTKAAPKNKREIVEVSKNSGTRKNNGSNGKLTQEQFTLKAIKSLRREGYKGIHSVYSGYNAAFRAYFDNDPIEATKVLAATNVIETHPTRGGAMLYAYGEMGNGGGSSKALDKILA